MWYYIQLQCLAGPEVLLQGTQKWRKLKLIPKTCLSELLGEWQVYRGSKRNPGKLKAVTI